MRENFGAKSFQQALISNELKIICKVLKGIYTSLVEGGGVPCSGDTDRSVPDRSDNEQRSARVVACVDS